MNQFICGDCQEEMKKISSETIDLVFTSPPYADQIKDYGKRAKRISTDNYVEWFIPKAQEIFRILKPTGSFVLNISDKLVGKYQDLFAFKLLIAICEQAGFHLVRDYIWYNPATPPNVFSRGNMGRTKKSHEYCFWFSKTEEWTFNMNPIRKPYGKDMLKFLEGKGKGTRADNTRPSRHNFKLDQQWTNHGGSDPEKTQRGSPYKRRDPAYHPGVHPRGDPRLPDVRLDDGRMLPGHDPGRDRRPDGSHVAFRRGGGSERSARRQAG